MKKILVRLMIAMMIFSVSACAEGTAVAVENEEAVVVEYIEIDPFDEEIFGQGRLVDVYLEGTDPFVCLYLRNCAGLNDPIAHINYTADNAWNLKNGDTVTISASMSEKYMEQGYVLTRTETTIPVEGFDRYASDVADFPADLLTGIADRAYQECVSAGSVDIYDGRENMTPWGARLENIRVGETALLAVNNRIDMEYSFLLVPVYKTITTDEWYDMEANANVTKTWEDVVGYYKFMDLVVHPDGSVAYNDSYVEMYGNYTDASAADAIYLNPLKSNYTFIEVPLT